MNTPLKCGKKHRALKTGNLKEIALERHFKPIVEPLKRIAERVENSSDGAVLAKTARKESTYDYGDDDDDDDDDDDVFKATTPDESLKVKTKQQWPIETAASPTIGSTPIESRKMIRSTPIESRTTVTPYVEREEEVYETDEAPISLETSARETLQTAQGHDLLHSQLGPLGQKYIGDLLGGENKNANDHVYGVYVSKDGTKLGDKRFDVDKDDAMIIDGTRYVGTPGLYELIFKRLPDDLVYTKNDLQTYKSILLTTNAHRRGRSASMPIMGNKGYKYSMIIGLLIRGDKKKGAGATRVPSTMRVTDNKVDYVHWDDPNELTDRLRLLDSSRLAGNNAHDNEILSIIEELREAGFIIN
ncbi:PREDICTED: uncharacterized protein LOC105555879 [Vollenhovia emeryi]|uniref:uncharacterized protein LOC105555879 n=1 Tax=Vollenhovia emeryi TaxID=411798 RepID=UPI0005F579FA|nr:PREDICTED: uncharacterized protein LOC105555879 [Vollenhovia emeryi]